MNSNLTHKIKHRTFANDEFMTPSELAKSLAKLLPDLSNLIVLEPCPGDGAFIKAIPGIIPLEGDFYSEMCEVDWIVTNPPYSDLDNWLHHSFELAEKGVALLIGLLNLTPKRLEMANRMGFGVTTIHLCKVFHWFGISAFIIWQKNHPDILTYDRIVWR